MSLYPGSLCPWIEVRFLDGDGNPLVGGFVYTYSAGTVTPLAVFRDADLLVPHANPLELDSVGRPPGGAIYLARAGYKFRVNNADGETLYTRDDVADVGAIFAGNFGLEMYAGGKDVVSGYEVLNTDRLVTVDSDAGADPCVIQMISAALSQQEVTIKNMGGIAIALTPAGVETIDGELGPYTIPAAVSPNFPAVTMRPDGVSGWIITSSHGLS